MSDDATPAKVRLTDGLGPDVTAWVCEYMSGEVFVSLTQYPMHDPDVRKAWRLFTIAQRDAAVAAERERCAKLCESLEGQPGNPPGLPNGYSCAAAIRAHA